MRQIPQLVVLAVLELFLGGVVLAADKDASPGKVTQNDAPVAARPGGCPEGPPCPKTKQATDQMHKMDANKDSQVSKEEYMMYQEKKFDAMDKDKNKALSQQEWLQRQLQETDGSSY